MPHLRRVGLGLDFGFTLVDPLHMAVDAGQRPPDGPPQVAGTLELQAKAR